MTDCAIHQPAPAECEPTHGQESCPWCIVRKLLTERDELRALLGTAHDAAVGIVHGIANGLNPRLKEETCPGPEKSGRGKTGRAKRTRASKSSSPSTEPAGSGDAAASTAGEP